MAEFFERLAQKFEALPEQIQFAWEQATIQQIDEEANKLEKYLVQHSGSASLNAHMETGVTAIPHEFYERYVDWNDTLIVNVEEGKTYGRDAQKPREKGKRNFSIAPATYHDLAYIINYGHATEKGVKIEGNRFIDNGKRRLKGWKQRRDERFERKLQDISKEFK